MNLVICIIWPWFECLLMSPNVFYDFSIKVFNSSLKKSALYQTEFQKKFPLGLGKVCLLSH